MVTPRSLNGKWQSQGIKPRVVMVKKKRERKEKKKRWGGYLKKGTRERGGGLSGLKETKEVKYNVYNVLSEKY